MLILVFCCWIAFFLGWNLSQKTPEAQFDQRELKYVRDNYLRKEGGSRIAGVESYDLRSFDGGKNWCAVKQEGNEVKILGPAETTYPGLVKKLGTFDALMRFVSQNKGKEGKLSPEERVEYIRLLRESGFTVEEQLPALPPSR